MPVSRVESTGADSRCRQDCVLTAFSETSPRKLSIMKEGSQLAVTAGPDLLSLAISSRFLS